MLSPSNVQDESDISPLYAKQHVKTHVHACMSVGYQACNGQNGPKDLPMHDNNQSVWYV